MPCPQPINLVCIALALTIYGSTLTSAGVIVLDGNGIVTTFTPNTGPNLYFYQGSYNDNSSLVYDTAGNQSTLANEFGNNIATYNTSTPNQTVTYVFADLSVAPSSDPDKINVTHIFYGSFGWSNTNNSNFYPQKTDTTADPGFTNTSKLIYWASTTAPASNVPEPSTAIAMGLLGVVGFAGNRRRRGQVSAA